MNIMGKINRYEYNGKDISIDMNIMGKINRYEYDGKDR